jgi:glycosyltransferase involved in cell wall biosynthesis
MVVLDTAKVLLKNNYFVLVICPKSGPLLNDFLENGIPVLVEEDLLYVQYKKISTIYFSKYLAIDSIISQFDVSIFVSLTNYNIVKRYFNTQNKIIWWIHEGSESYKALVERIPENLPSNIQVYYGGDYSKNEAKSNGYFYPSEILNYGVVDEYKKKDKINSKKIIFLIAGTICIRKGQRIFLQAINLLNDSEMENCEFLFLGDCYDNDKTGIMVKNEIKEYSKKHKNIKFMESISRKELYKLYSKIDVLVVPSIDDPMPIVATENFMFKNICLCSDRTGTSYYMKDGYNGFIFKSQNYVELAQKLKYIIEHKFDLDFIRKKW